MEPAEKAAAALRKKAAILDAHKVAVDALDATYAQGVAEAERARDAALVELVPVLANLVADAHHLDERPPTKPRTRKAPEPT